VFPLLVQLPGTTLNVTARLLRLVHTRLLRFLILVLWTQTYMPIIKSMNGLVRDQLHRPELGKTG
jgi:hypothetical protein